MPPPGAPEAIPSGHAFVFSVTGVALEGPFSTGVGGLDAASSRARMDGWEGGVWGGPLIGPGEAKGG